MKNLKTMEIEEARKLITSLYHSRLRYKQINNDSMKKIKDLRTYSSQLEKNLEKASIRSRNLKEEIDAWKADEAHRIKNWKETSLKFVNIAKEREDLEVVNKEIKDKLTMYETHISGLIAQVREIMEQYNIVKNEQAKKIDEQIKKIDEEVKKIDEQLHWQSEYERIPKIIRWIVQKIYHTKKKAQDKLLAIEKRYADQSNTSSNT